MRWLQRFWPSLAVSSGRCWEGAREMVAAWRRAARLARDLGKGGETAPRRAPGGGGGGWRGRRCPRSPVLEGEDKHRAGWRPWARGEGLPAPGYGRSLAPQPCLAQGTLLQKLLFPVPNERGAHTSPSPGSRVYCVPLQCPLAAASLTNALFEVTHNGSPRLLESTSRFGDKLLPGQWGCAELTLLCLSEHISKNHF